MRICNGQHQRIAKSTLDAIVPLEKATVIGDNCKIGDFRIKIICLHEEKVDGEDYNPSEDEYDESKHGKKCSWCPRVIGAKNADYYLCDHCANVIHKGCLKKALANFEDIDNTTELKCPDCHSEDKLITKSGRKRWIAIF